LSKRDLRKALLMLAEDVGTIQDRIDAVTNLNGVPDRAEVERWCEELARLEVLAYNLAFNRPVISLVRVYTSRSTLVEDITTILERQIEK
jgi:hypothetical protein